MNVCIVVVGAYKAPAVREGKHSLHQIPIWALMHKVVTRRLPRSLFGSLHVEVVFRLVLELLDQKFHAVVQRGLD